jgi:ribosomal protein L11 methyltransferase
MFSLEVAGTPENNDLLIAELWDAGSAGIAELDGGRLRAFFEDDADRARLVEKFRAVTSRQEEECDWVAVSRLNWEPLLVGKRFLLVPEWRDDPAPEDRFRIVVNPGMAFGTGIHETTQLCMEAIETYVRSGMAVLDVGTGSGILAQAARLLGASPVWACDVDPVAVGIAGRKQGASFFIGSVGAVRSGSADLIAANISPEAIALLMPDLLRSLGPGGTALLSGFERHEVPELQAEVEHQGGLIRQIRYKGNWALVEAFRKLR